MFANYTEETCTGTGTTLALAGATTGRIPFSESFADGDLVAYVVEDSGGTIKVAGVGTYVSATDDITRNDTWNWNGTAINDNPSTNITLSGGTHTVRCDVVGDDLNTGGVTSSRIYASSLAQEISSSVQIGANEIAYIPLELKFSGSYDNFAFDVTTSGGNARLGLYDTKDGLPNNLLAVHDTSFSVGSTGLKTPSFDGGALHLRKGNYYIGVALDTGTFFRASQSDSSSYTQLGVTAMNSVVAFAWKSLTYAAMPDPADVASLTYATGNFVVMGLEAV